ncbi:hypothetical protein AMTRI_Chr06g172480 [Amborella trichopoda]
MSQISSQRVPFHQFCGYSLLSITYGDQAFPLDTSPVGWLKLNFDGSVRHESHKACFGGILRNHDGDIIFSFFGQLAFGDINEAELKAVKKRVSRLTSDHNHIIIEGDSANVINWCSHPFSIPWRYTSILGEIGFAILAKEVCFSHINRERNDDADALAKIGSS